ncbi:MAG: putative membrane protein SpoIIM required for sporulation [Paraglaciecola sp.]|jgi:uncharacterized membrane protein SpoIIM required for sporulation
MKQHEFVKQRRTQWQEFSDMLKDPEQCKERDMPKMYRQLSHDLAIAKSRHYSPVVVNHLNQLLLLGQQQLYKPVNHIFSPLLHFVQHTFPEHLLQLRSYILWAHFLFYGIALLAFGITLFEPDFVRNVMANIDVVQLEKMYDPSSAHYAKERAADSDFVMFGYYIMHNISIAFQCFVGGLLLGFGALYFLLFNALFFGAVSGHIVNIGYTSTFFSFVITHGAFELSAIVLSAAAGMVVGIHLIRPGKVSRLEALQESARLTFPIIFGAFLLLMIAAFIEAFWSSSISIPSVVKYVVGSICWLWMLFYIFRRGADADR